MTEYAYVITMLIGSNRYGTDKGTISIPDHATRDEINTAVIAKAARNLNAPLDRSSVIMLNVGRN